MTCDPQHVSVLMVQSIRAEVIGTNGRFNELKVALSVVTPTDVKSALMNTLEFTGQCVYHVFMHNVGRIHQHRVKRFKSSQLTEVSSFKNLYFLREQTH